MKKLELDSFINEVNPKINLILGGYKTSTGQNTIGGVTTSTDTNTFNDQNGNLESTQGHLDDKARNYEEDDGQCGNYHPY